MSLRRMILFAAFFGGVLLAASPVFLERTGENGPYRAVAGVRHSARIEAPRPSRTMLASYYGRSFEGAVTASRSTPRGTRLPTGGCRWGRGCW